MAKILLTFSTMDSGYGRFPPTLRKPHEGWVTMFLFPTQIRKNCCEGFLELLEKFANRAGNVDSARSVALAVFYALHDSGRLGALGAIGALGGVHFLTVCCFGNLGHNKIS